jgi:putative ABC transport system ATP-binding protein
MSTPGLRSTSVTARAGGDSSNGSIRTRTGEPIIRVMDLSHSFGEGTARSQVLFNLSLDIWPGELVILTGPNGAGKTTLLTLIGALRSVQEGGVWVMGKDLTGLDPEEQAEVREDIGFIFQAHNLFASLTAFQTVMMALELKEQPAAARRQRTTQILTLLGLGKHLHHKPAALSGGQKQRVAIGRALANRPRLVLADEPTAALDQKSGRDVVLMLRQLARDECCTTLMVSHEPRIFDAADRVITMVAGRIQTDVSVRDSVTVTDLLGRHHDFAALSPAALSELAAKMGKERHQAGDVIFRQGQEGDKFYVIWGGAVDVLVSEGGEETHRATLTAGECFGATSLLTGKGRSATVRAREEVELFALERVDFLAALEGRSTTGL